MIKIFNKFKLHYNIIKYEFSQFFFLFISSLPTSEYSYKIRKLYYNKKLKVPILKKNIKIHHNAKIICPSLVHLENGSVLAENSCINACDSKGVYIGENTLIGPNVYIRSANHNFSILNKPISEQGHNYKEIVYCNKNYSIVIESNVWVGANSVITSGAHIKSGSIISAGSLVTNEVPENSIVVGNPGRISGKRK